MSLRNAEPLEAEGGHAFGALECSEIAPTQIVLLVGRTCSPPEATERLRSPSMDERMGLSLFGYLCNFDLTST